MPELPEVHTVVSDLNKKIINKKIKDVKINLLKIVKNKTKEFKRVLINNSFVKVGRRGKLMIFKLEREEKYLLIHLRMTGQAIYEEGKGKIIAGGHSDKKEIKLPNKHTHVIISFSDNSKLYYNDQRQFGYLQLVNKKELDIIKNKFGIEPLSHDFTLSNFKKLIENKKINIKAFLLNQKYIAGIGNIYADEILFASRINPKRTTNSLNSEEINKIFKNIKLILKKAIDKRGTTFNDYRDAEGRRGNFIKFLKVYNRENKKCKRCSHLIKKTKVAGRGTRFCERCQK